MGKLLRLWQISGADLRLLWTVLHRADRPRWLLPAVVALGFFALDPLNLAILPLGLLDDVVLLPLLLHALAQLAAASSRGQDKSREQDNLRSREDRVVSIQ
jgi:uncharacterized membrane protein YkvA (DUF1232 family)